MTDLQQGQQSRKPHSNSNLDQLARGSGTTTNGETLPLLQHPDGLKQQETESLEEESDACSPSSGRTVGYWITLLFFVGPFYVIPPLSWAYTVYTAARLWQKYIKEKSLSRALHTWEWLLLTYTVSECLFSVYYYLLCRKVSKCKSQVPKRDPAELRLAIQRLLQDLEDLDSAPTQLPDSSFTPANSSTNGEIRSGLLSPSPPRLSHNDPRAVDFRNHFRLWFHGKPWRQISRQSMREWFAWSLFDARFEVLDEWQKEMVEDAVVLVECRAGDSLLEVEGEEGANPDVVRLTSDPIVTWSRPGLLYAISGALTAASGWWLKWKYGMIKQEFAGIGYLIREGSPISTSRQFPDPEPIVLLHGLGFGLLQYFYTIVYILNRIPQQQPLVVALDPSISQSIWDPSHLKPMSRRNWIQGLTGLIEKHGWDGVTMVSHSKGSYVHTWMLKEHTELVKRSCFADPVCFCIWEGDLCWNFIYRTPRDAWQLIIKYFAATEPGISLVVQRHFDWVANALWVEEIPRSTEQYYTSFLLGGLDVVINTARVRRYLEKHGIREGIHWNPRGHHAQAAIGGTGLQNIVDWLLMPSPSTVSTPP